MRFRFPLVLLLVIVITAITPLAYAQSPDPVWLDGYFDGGDEDDAIIHIQTNLGAITPPVIYVADYTAPLVSFQLQPYETGSPSWLSSQHASRGPPTP